MSTKNLARTVIEGGRCNGNKFERRASHRTARAKLRPSLELALRDPERADAMTFGQRKVVYRCFRDKLGPADRWMRKQVGRPWRNVENDLRKLFDTRTVAGRHVVFDHMLPHDRWNHDGTWNIDSTHFFVDTKGFLRTTVPSWRMVSRRKDYVPNDVLERAHAWARARRVIIRGEVLYWAEPTVPSALPDELRYRQARRLNEQELEFFDNLPKVCRELLTWPGRSSRA